MKKQLVFTIFCVALGLTIVGCCIWYAKEAIHFLTKTASSFTAPPMSETHFVERLILHHCSLYEGQVLFNPVFVRLTATPGLPPAGTPLPDLTHGLGGEVHYQLTLDLVEVAEDFGLQEHVLDTFIANVQGYFLPTTRYPNVPDDTYLCCDNASAVVVLNVYAGRSTEKLTKFLRQMSSRIPSGFRMTVTSPDEMASQMQNSVPSDLEHVDSVSLPVAFILFMICTRSIRLMVLPLLILPISILFSFAILRPISKKEKFAPIAPEMVAVTICALGLDFSLFILTRFRETAQLRIAIPTPVAANREAIDPSSNGGGRTLNHSLQPPPDANVVQDLTNQSRWVIRIRKGLNTIRFAAVSGYQYVSDPPSPEAISRVLEEHAALSNGCRCCLSACSRNKNQQGAPPSHAGGPTPENSRLTFGQLALESRELRMWLVLHSVYGAAKNVVLSGLTITLCFTSMTFSKSPWIRTGAIGSAVGSGLTVVVSLTVSTVALYLAYYPLMVGLCEGSFAALWTRARNCFSSSQKKGVSQDTVKLDVADRNPQEVDQRGDIHKRSLMYSLNSHEDGDDEEERDERAESRGEPHETEGLLSQKREVEHEKPSVVLVDEQDANSIPSEAPIASVLPPTTGLGVAKRPRSGSQYGTVNDAASHQRAENVTIDEVEAPKPQEQEDGDLEAPTASSATGSKEEAAPRSLWYKLGRGSFEHPVLVIGLCILLLAAPGYAFAASFRVSYDLMLEVDFRSQTTKEYLDITKNFSPLVNAPFYFAFFTGEGFSPPRPTPEPMFSMVDLGAVHDHWHLYDRVTRRLAFDWLRSSSSSKSRPVGGSVAEMADSEPCVESALRSSAPNDGPVFQFASVTQWLPSVWSDEQASWIAAPDFEESLCWLNYSFRHPPTFGDTENVGLSVSGSGGNLSPAGAISGCSDSSAMGAAPFCGWNSNATFYTAIESELLMQSQPKYRQLVSVLGDDGGTLGRTKCLLIPVYSKGDPYRAAGAELAEYLESVYKDFTEGDQARDAGASDRYDGLPLGHPGQDYGQRTVGGLQPPGPEGFSNDVLSSFVGWQGPNAPSYSLMKHTYLHLPFSLGLSAGSAFVIVLLYSRSLLVSIRLMLTLCYTIAMSFGVSSALFCQEWSHPTLFPGIPDLDSIMWLIPVLVTPLLLALAIDYDFFLLVRIVELRDQKRREIFATSTTPGAPPIPNSCSWLRNRRSLPVSDEAHIVGAAVQRTGSVITYAAFMMFFAFGGLLLSGTLMLRQFGCFVVVAVIVDAFVVRPMLVPALMGLWPSALWWPRQ